MPPMIADVRLSGPTLKVLSLCLAAPEQPKSGADITRAVKVPPGTLYPLLARLEEKGWMSGEWQQLETRVDSRRRQRFYKLTPDGQQRAIAALADLRIPNIVPSAPC